MNKRTIYCNYVDLGLYLFCTTTFGLAGLYCFDNDVAHTNDEFDCMEILQWLREPFWLDIKVKRALALAFAGSQYETEELRAMIISELKVRDDVFLTVALGSVSGGECADLAHRMLLEIPRETAEEEIMAIPVLDLEEDNLLNFVMRLSEKLRFRQDLLHANPKMLETLFTLNKSRVKSALIQSIESGVVHAPKESSVALSEMITSGYRLTYVYNAALVLSQRSTYKKAEKAKELLREALALSTLKWTNDEKDMVKQLHGQLNNRIINESNYKWYYGEFGFSYPELSVNLDDKVAVKKFIPILSDADLIEYAEYAESPALKPKFKEWNPIIAKYCDGSKRGTNKLYRICMQDFAEVYKKYGLGDEVLAVFDVTEEVPEEYRVEFAGLLKERSYSDWVRFIQKFELFDGLTAEDLDLYTQLELFDDPETLRGYEEQLGKFMYITEAVPRLIEWLKKHEVEDPGTLEVLEQLVMFSDEDIDELLSVADKVALMDHRFDLRHWGECGCLVESVRRYRLDVPSYRDMASYYAKQFYQWTGITLVNAIHNPEQFFKLHPILPSIWSESTASERYKKLMPEVFRVFIKGGNVNSALNSICSLRHLVGEKTDWEDAWLDRMEKPVKDLCSLSRSAVNFGCIDGVNCIYTNVGVIAAEEIVLGDVPVFVQDDAGGKVVKVHIPAPIEKSFIMPVINMEIYSAGYLNLMLRRI